VGCAASGYSISKDPVVLREAVTLQQKVGVPNGVLVQSVGEGAVLLDVPHGLYFGLDETGYQFWSAVISSATVEEAFLRLRDDYEVGDEELKCDLLALVNELVANGLLTVVEA